jgi:hypothetical protein
MTVTVGVTDVRDEAAQAAAGRSFSALKEYFLCLSQSLESVTFRSLEELEEDEDFDFLVRVPTEKLFGIRESLADLSFYINEKYGVKIATLAVAA